MDIEEREHLTQLRCVHLQNLRIMELKQAKMGLHTPGYILIEIDELSGKIADIDARLNYAGPAPTLLVSHSPTVQIEIVFKGDFDALTEEIQQKTIRVLAALVDVPPDQIRIVRTMSGSIIFRVAMPKDAADRLLDLYNSQDPIIEDAEIMDIRTVEILATIDPNMPGFDRPDSLKGAFHDQVAHLRKQRGFTPAGLVERVQALKAGGFSFNEDISIAWLLEIEEGTRSRISPALVNLLTRALGCNDEERFSLLVAAFPTYIFGEEVARLRSLRDLSRPDLVKRLLKLLDKLDPDGLLKGEKISESWVRQIEEGRKVKVPGTVVEMLAEALESSEVERAKLLIAADRNPLRDSAGNITEGMEFILSVAEVLSSNPRGAELLRKIYINDPETFSRMTTGEVLGVFEKFLAQLEMNERIEKNRTED